MSTQLVERTAHISLGTVYFGSSRSRLGHRVVTFRIDIMECLRFKRSSTVLSINIYYKGTSYKDIVATQGEARQDLTDRNFFNKHPHFSEPLWL